MRRLIVLLAVLVAPAAPAQYPQPAENPDLELVGGGVVHAVARQPDGGLIVGGYFASVLGVPRSNIARFNADGTLDADWNPVVHGFVHALAVDANGEVFLGGTFSKIDDVQRAHLAKLSGSTGQLDLSWNPGASEEVRALAIDTQDRLIAGGAFRTIGGADRRNLARLETGGTGTIDLSWHPAPSSRVEAIAVDADGSMIVGGQFHSIAGQQHGPLAKFLPDGQLDPQWRPDPYGTVRALARGLDGSVYVGGSFSAIGGQSRNGIAKLSASGTGSADPAWDPSPDRGIHALAVDAAGAVYAGGFFKQIGGKNRRHLAKLDGGGQGLVDPDWDFSANNLVRALLADGNDVVVGGEFSLLADNTRLALASISSSGSINGVFDVELPGGVMALLPAPGGGVFAGGWFARAGGLPRHNLLRIDAEGHLDPHWAPTTDQEVIALAYDPRGSVYAGGYFSVVDGQPRGRLAKLSARGIGELDPAWTAHANDGVYALAVDAGGSVYAGGFFSTINGQPRTHLAKFSGSSGTLDPDWNPSPNHFVHALVVDGDSLFVGGTFSSGYSPLSIGGQAREGIARLSLGGVGAADPLWDPSLGGVSVLALDPQGALYVGRRSNKPSKVSRTGAGIIDSSWMPYVYNPAVNHVSALALDRTGLLYVGGRFMAVGIDHPTRLARVNAEGAGLVDPTWEPMPENAEIAGVFTGNGSYALAVDERGTLFVGGGFSTIGGLRRVGLAAFPDRILVDDFDG